MTTKLVRQGGSTGAIVLDTDLVKLLDISYDTVLAITTDGKSIIITPVNETSKEEDDFKKIIEKVVAENASVLEKLSKN